VKFQRHDADGDAKENCKTIGFVKQDVGECDIIEDKDEGIADKISGE